MGRITHWLEKYIIVGWLAIFVLSGIALILYFDREPPFKMLAYTEFNATRGESLLVVAQVERQVERDCTVNFSRYLFDSNGVRHTIEGPQEMGPAALRDLEETSPGVLKVAFIVPMAAASGPAVIVTPLKYTCNIMHNVTPIEVLLKMKVQILP